MSIYKKDRVVKTTSNPLHRLNIAEPAILPPRKKLTSAIISVLMMGSMLPAMAFADTTISGVKFNDLNGNGVQDAGEKGRSFETIFIRNNDLMDKGDSSGFYQITTDVSGHYTSGGHKPGSYTIWTEVPDGFGETVPVQTSAADGMNIPYDFTVTASTTSKEVNFGMWDGVDRTGQIIVAVDDKWVDAGEKVALTGAFIDPNVSNKHTATIEADGNKTVKVITEASVRRALRANKPTNPTTTPITATNTFTVAGNFPVNAQVTNAQGQTGQNTGTAVVHDVNTSDPCATGQPTVFSTKSGDWTDPNTWTPVGVPKAKDWVMIRPGNIVTLPATMKSSTDNTATVTGLCVDANGKIQSASGGWVTLHPKTIHNKGSIVGQNGSPTGSPVFIGYPTRFVNDGTILSGSGSVAGASGGKIEIYSGFITNNGTVQSGNGVGGRYDGVAGSGGNIIMSANNPANFTNNGTIRGGNGGWVNHGKAGSGGHITANAANQKGIIDGSAGGYYDPIHMTFSNTTRIHNADIFIATDEDGTIEANDLVAGAISADNTLTLAVGQGGVIDLSKVADKALKAGQEVKIYADKVILPAGKTLNQLVEAPKLTTGPGKILYQAVWSTVEYIADEPNNLVSIPLTLLNVFPKEDTYTIRMTDSQGWELCELPETVTVNSQRQTELGCEVLLPQERGVEDVITVTATSQNDPDMTAVAEIHLSVNPAEAVEPPPPTTETGATAFGKLVDEFNQPVAGATIQLEGQTVTTDAEGNWLLTGLPEGKPAYVATLTGDGYQSQVIQCQQNKESKYGCYSKPLNSLLQLKVGVSPSPIVGLGENLTYNLTVTNTGTQTATGVALQEVLPTGTQLVSLQPLNGGSCDTNAVSCTLPDLTAGASTKVKLVVKPTEVNKLENTIKVTANNYPGEVAKTVTEVKPLLSVSTKDTPDPVNMLDKLHYTYQVELSKSASAPATGVNLVSQLPSGVELQTAKTEFGDCDTTALPKVSCPLPDLQVGSSTAVNLEVLLKDAGMLLLTNDATVTAANYPAHTFKERTHIFVPDDIKIDMVFVIDTTNSMQEEINGVVEAIKKFIAEVEPGQRPTAALVTFKDDVKVEAFTQDLTVLLGVAEKLQATGGGTCPEASAEALGIAIKHLQDGGVLMLATDASPYESADVTGLAEQIRTKNMKFHALVTGDCTDQQSWNEVK